MTTDHKATTETERPTFREKVRHNGATRDPQLTEQRRARVLAAAETAAILGPWT